MGINSTLALVKIEDFKRCDQSGFCVRQRAYAELIDYTVVSPDAPQERPWYELTQPVIDRAAGVFSAQLHSNSDVYSNSTIFTFRMTALLGDCVHIQMQEMSPLKPRYEGTEFVDRHPSVVPVAFSSEDYDNIQHTLTFDGGGGEMSKIVIREKPFVITAFRGNISSKLKQKLYHACISTKSSKVFTFNEDGYLWFEHTRQKPSVYEDARSDDDDNLKRIKADLRRGMWEETFGGVVDSKPNG